MIAAIYARKSTDDSDHNAEARSTQRQIESARTYAESKRWHVAPSACRWGVAGVSYRSQRPWRSEGWLRFDSMAGKS